MIIETKEEFKEFLNAYKDNSVILIPIMSDNKRNVLNNKLCLLFVKILNRPEYYILPFTHSETLNLDKKILDHILLSDNKKYVLDKKEFLKIYKAKNLIDVNIIFYLNTNVPAEISQKYSKAELSFISKSVTTDNIYDVIPILKIKERLVDYANNMESIINANIQSESQEAFEFLNNKTIECLGEIEKNGIYINKEKLLKYHPQYSIHVDDSNLVYTDYNIYTSTGRPSNRFGNLNFAALNKDNGERAFIESRFGGRGVLFYFDYEAYHLNLVADLVDYTFPPDISIHEYLGRQYFGKKSLTESEYNESKVVSFNILYGGIHDTIARAIPFFGKTQEFITKMWKDYQNNGYISTKISQKKIYPDNLDSMSSNKLFNYYLQNYETEKNILIIEKLNDLLSNHSTKLIMYLYDGFLFDYCLDDDKKLYKDIKNILQDANKFKTKQYVGKNFDKMKKID